MLYLCFETFFFTFIPTHNIWSLKKIAINQGIYKVWPYLAIKLQNFVSVDEKLPKLEPRVSHNFDIKIVSREKLLKVLASPYSHFWLNFSVSKSHSVYEISQYFFAILKLYLWSIHMANNLILAISFGFKLNSNLKIRKPSQFLSFLSLGQKEKPFWCDMSCLNFETMLPLLLFAIMIKKLPPSCSCLSPSKGLKGTNCLLRPWSWLKPCLCYCLLLKDFECSYLCFDALFFSLYTDTGLASWRGQLYYVLASSGQSSW